MNNLRAQDTNLQLGMLNDPVRRALAADARSARVLPNRNWALGLAPLP
jgi:hypothetical protein